MSKVIEIIDSDEDTESVPTPTPSIAKTENSPQSQSRRRPRKIALQNLPDPDMQFETIAVDDDNNSCPSEDYGYLAENNTSRTQPRHSKATPNILSSKAPTNADIVDGVFEDFLADSEVKESMEAIALERVRINQLLMLFGMPDIIFSLYTQPELLKFQFEERLKQQKIMQNRIPGNGQGDVE